MGTNMQTKIIVAIIMLSMCNLLQADKPNLRQTSEVPAESFNCNKHDTWGYVGRVAELIVGLVGLGFSVVAVAGNEDRPEYKFAREWAFAPLCIAALIATMDGLINLILAGEAD